MEYNVVYDKASGAVIHMEEQTTAEKVFDVSESIYLAFTRGEIQLSIVGGALEVLNEPVSTETVGSYIPE